MKLSDSVDSAQDYFFFQFSYFFFSVFFFCWFCFCALHLRWWSVGTIFISLNTIMKSARMSRLHGEIFCTRLATLVLAQRIDLCASTCVSPHVPCKMWMDRNRVSISTMRWNRMSSIIRLAYVSGCECGISIIYCDRARECMGKNVDDFSPHSDYLWLGLNVAWIYSSIKSYTFRTLQVACFHRIYDEQTEKSTQREWLSETIDDGGVVLDWESAAANVYRVGSANARLLRQSHRRAPSENASRSTLQFPLFALSDSAQSECK